VFLDFGGIFVVVNVLQPYILAVKSLLEEHLSIFGAIFCEYFHGLTHSAFGLYGLFVVRFRL